MRTLLLFLTLFSMLTPAWAQNEYKNPQDWIAQAERKSIKEPKTEILFPLVLPAAGTQMKHLLVGAGARTKTIFGVKVYAVGFYLDGERALGELTRYKIDNPKKLQKNPRFYERFMHENFGKSIRIVMARDVDSDDMREAFDDVLRPAVRKRSKDQEQQDALTALNKFIGYFKSELRKGDELIFTWQNGTLFTSYNRREMGQLQSPTLAYALFDVYLGQDPVSDRAKEGFFTGLPQFFRRLEMYRNSKGRPAQPETEVESAGTPGGGTTTPAQKDSGGN